MACWNKLVYLKANLNFQFHQHDFNLGYFAHTRLHGSSLRCSEITIQNSKVFAKVHVNIDLTQVSTVWCPLGRIFHMDKIFVFSN